MRITRFISLIGKLVQGRDVLNDPSLKLTDEEKDIVRNAIDEYKFYHGHEAPKAEDLVEKSGASKTLGLAGRGAKATR